MKTSFAKTAPVFTRPFHRRFQSIKPGASPRRVPSVFKRTVIPVIVTIFFTALTAAGAAPPANLKALEKSARSGNAAAQFELGQRLLEQNKEARAIDWFQKAAGHGHVEARYKFATALANGNPEAMFLMGLMYKDGNGVDKDRALAIDWLKKAATAGHEKAARILARQWGINVEVKRKVPTATQEKKTAAPDGKKDLRRIKKRAFAGDPQAQFALAERYRTGDGIEKSEAMALKWYQRAARQGQVDAQFIFAGALKKQTPEALFLMGLMYRTGDGVIRNIPLAIKWLKKAAAKGHANAQYTLGSMYENGDGVTKDITRAKKWLRLAADQGHPEAKDALAIIDAENGDADIACRLARKYAAAGDTTKAFAWYLKAAKKGKITAMIKVAESLAHGTGIRKSLAKAARWYRRAAEKDDREGQYRLALALISGRGVKRSLPRAVVWLKKAVAGNYLPARLKLGMMYHDGLGVKQDYAEALRLLRPVATAGNPRAAVTIAGLYADGRGTAVNHKKARAWYVRAAVAGETEAYYRYGRYLRLGIGGGKDFKGAVRWYRLAAAAGDVNAGFELGLMYARGQGVRASAAEAVKRFTRAAKNGNAAARYYLGLACENGAGTRQNLARARSLYTRAAKNGHTGAAFRLGLLSLSGRGRQRQDLAAALAYLQKATAGGEKMAAFFLGYMYETGTGVRKDMKKARGYYSRAAKGKNLYGIDAINALINR